MNFQNLGWARNVQFLFLFLLPFTSLPRWPEGTGFLNSLPTWRYVNIAFVLFGGILLLPKLMKLDRRVCFYLFAGVFLVTLMIQHLMIPGGGLSRAAASIVGICFLMGMVSIIYQMLSLDFWNVMRVLNFSACATVIYQIYQVLVVTGLHQNSWALILNDSDQSEISNFFRMIGSWYGAPGFYSESGHAALFLGPWAMIQLIVWRNFGGKAPILVVVVCLLGLAISASVGGALQILFIAATATALTLLIKGRSVARQQIAIALALLLFVTPVLFVFQYDGVNLWDFVIGRYHDWSEGGTSRQVGAVIMMEIFHSYPLSGVGFGNLQSMLACDPNTFVPNFLATHGIIVALAFLLLLVVPFLLEVKSLTQVVALAPLLSVAFHLGNAYGTYTWPQIWLVYAITLFLVHALKRPARQRVVASQRATVAL